jgi:hypothetical protein
MSRTELYRLGKNPECIGKVNNSWRGAMYVWTDIAKRYFGLEHFPMFDEAMRMKVWNASGYHPNMPTHDRIVLASTMDNVVVYGRDMQRAIDAFEKYGAEHPNSSLSEQAKILRATEFGPDDAAAWNQTSVNEFWGYVHGEESEDGEQDVSFYDLKSDAKEHSDAFEKLDTVKGGT